MATLQVETTFFPLAFILNAVTPNIEIDGVVHKRKWGWAAFDLEPGEHTVEVSFPYMGPKTGKAKVTVTITSPDEVVAYKYTAPMIMFMDGSMSAHSGRAPVQVGAADAGPQAPLSAAEAPHGVHPRTGLAYSSKSKMVAGLLQIFLGFLGAGRFYTGHIGMGIGQLVVTWITCGFGAIWPFVDGIIMLTGEPTDSEGRPLQ